MADDWTKEKDAAKKALIAFQQTLAAELAGSGNAADVRNLANTTHVHNTLLLFGDPPVWGKDALVIQVRINFGEVVSGDTLGALMNDDGIPKGNPHGN